MEMRNELRRTPFQRRFTDLLNERQAKESEWKDLKRYINPTRGRFDKKPNEKTDIDYQALLDGEPQVAAGILASGMQSGMTSQASQWFKLGVLDPDLNDYQPVREWLDDALQRMMGVFARSNIYHEFYNNYDELGTFATACMGIFSDYENVIRCQTFTIGEYFFAVDVYGRVRTFGRMFYNTVENMVKEFGKENCSNAVQNLWNQNKLYEKIKVCHLIEPNDERQPHLKNSANKLYRSVYWEEGADEDKLLRISGFDRFPILGSRWGVATTSEVYGGGSPGFKCLGDAKSLQKIKKDQLTGLAKSINPPLMSPTGLAYVNALPGGITPYGGQSPDGLKPLYQVNFNPNDAEPTIAGIKEQINRCFYTDLFRMLTMNRTKTMTATEVAERHEEKLTVLAPVLDRVEAELLDPCIENTFEIMLEAGLIPEPPKELEGQELKVEYVSILAQAQKMVRTTGVEQFAAFVGNLSAVKPEVLDKFNADEAIDEYADMLGIPPKIVNSDEKVAEIRAARNQQMQQQVQMQQAAMMAQGAEVLSKADMGGNNALTALLGGPGQ